jgi:hypothetical protein
MKKSVNKSSDALPIRIQRRGVPSQCCATLPQPDGIPSQRCATLPQPDCILSQRCATMLQPCEIVAQHLAICSSVFMPLFLFVPLVIERILSTIFPYSLIFSNFNKGIRENIVCLPLLLREFSINKGRVSFKIDLHFLQSTIQVDNSSFRNILKPL